MSKGRELSDSPGDKVVKRSISIALCLLTICLETSPSFAEIKTFVKEYSYQASELDSKSTSRTMALEQAKRMLLEELGVFLVSKTDVIDLTLTKDQITSITAGVVSAQVLDEKWDGHVYWLKAKIDADPSLVKQAIEAIVKDTKKLTDLEAARIRIDTLTKQLEAVKNDIGSTTEDKQKRYNSIINKISANDMMQNYWTALLDDNLPAKELITILNEVIRLDANFFGAYEARAYQYKLLNKFKESEADYKKVISNNFNSFFAYAQLADIYFKKKEYDKIIDYEYLSVINSPIIYKSFVKIPQNIYDKLVKQYPNNYKIYLLRGYSNLRKAFGNKKVANYAISDFTKSLKLNDKQPIAYFMLAELFRDSIVFNMSDADYENATKSLIKYCTLGLVYNPTPNIAKELLFIRANYGHRGCELTSIDYERLSELEPNNSLYLKILAVQKFECDQNNQAIFYYKKAIEVTAKDNYFDLFSLHDDLAEIYVTTGETNLAIETYELALATIEKDIDKNKNEMSNNKNESMSSIYKNSLEMSIKQKNIILDKLYALKAGRTQK